MLVMAMLTRLFPTSSVTRNRYGFAGGWWSVRLSLVLSSVAPCIHSSGSEKIADSLLEKNTLNDNRITTATSDGTKIEYVLIPNSYAGWSMNIDGRIASTREEVFSLPGRFW